MCEKDNKKKIHALIQENLHDINWSRFNHVGAVDRDGRAGIQEFLRICGNDVEMAKRLLDTAKESKYRTCPLCFGKGITKKQTIEELKKEIEKEGGYLSTGTYLMKHYSENWGSGEEETVK